ncbi:MAG: hypothetical protein QMC85_00985 [Methanocellales archaeon]|nr:hypothetical protein [Methanocellales archaeon]
MDWSTIGILLGTIAFIRGIIRDIKRWKERPKLRVEFNPKLPSDLGYYRYVDLGIIRKFGCVRVRNIGKSLALRCVATLEILKIPGNTNNLDPEHTLHWADINYSFKTTEPEPIDIGSEPRRLDVVFSQPKYKIVKENKTVMPEEVKNSLALDYYPAGTYSYEFHGGMASIPAVASGSVITTTTPSTPLDLGDYAQQIVRAPPRGSWIAMPIALSIPDIANQAYLPPSEYLVKLRVTCENGRGDTICFKIISPNNWKDLDMKMLGQLEKLKNRGL